MFFLIWKEARQFQWWPDSVLVSIHHEVLLIHGWRCSCWTFPKSLATCVNWMNDLLTSSGDPLIYWRLSWHRFLLRHGIRGVPGASQWDRKLGVKGRVARLPASASVPLPLLRAPPTSGHPSSPASQCLPHNTDTHRCTLTHSAPGLPKRWSDVSVHQNPCRTC